MFILTFTVFFSPLVSSKFWFPSRRSLCFQAG